MAEVVENTENTENETPAVPQMSTVERAEMLLKQDATIREKIKSGATLDEAVDPSNKEFGPLGHPEQVQMRVAKRAMMLESGIAPYPVHLDVTNTIEEVRAKYDGKLEAGQETEDMVGIAGRVLFLRNAGGLCFVQLSEDTRTRKPYIGMIADENIRNMVRNRSKAVASLRRTFDTHDFLEVETPMLQTLHGGAAARPFTTHMNAFDLDLYLRIAPELFLKRCLVGGIDRVFEINRDFRNEGVDATHAPEFTMVEAYQAYGTYDSIGQLVKELVQQTAMDVYGSHKVTLLDGTEYDFGGEWKTISMYDSLSKPGVVEKWDLYVRGFELATGYSELNDPIVQRERFVAQAKDALAGDEEACDIDEDFLEALGVGMPPAGGMGMGIDRLLIALTGATIRETITFPLVKPLVG